MTGFLTFLLFFYLSLSLSLFFFSSAFFFLSVKAEQRTCSYIYRTRVQCSSVCAMSTDGRTAEKICQQSFFAVLKARSLLRCLGLSPQQRFDVMRAHIIRSGRKIAFAAFLCCFIAVPGSLFFFGVVRFFLSCISRILFPLAAFCILH